jgi:hypothetical protein
MTTIEELDEELALARASLERLKARTIADCTAELAYETDPYYRKMLEEAIERAKAPAG